MNRVPLGECAVRIRTHNPIGSGSAEFTYIDLSSVDNRAKRIVEPSVVAAAEAPSRARQIVATGDVLVSTVRPNLNAVAAVPQELDGATASTGFTVIRPNYQCLDGRYVFHWVRSSQFVGDMVRKATGASYPAVSDKIVKESLIPLPELCEQRRIADILDKVDALRAKRREAIVHLDALGQSIFHEMFGNETPNGVLSDAIKSLVGGRNVVGSDDSSNPKRVLKISAVTSGNYLESESKPLPDDYVPKDEHVVQAGDVIISRANTTELVGASALVEHTNGNMVLPDKLWRAVPTAAVASQFLVQALQTFGIRAQISRRSTGSGGSMKNISKPKLLGIPVYLPPLDLQQEFSKRVAAIESLKAKQRDQLAELDELFLSLQDRAFKGELR